MTHLTPLVDFDTGRQDNHDQRDMGALGQPRSTEVCDAGRLVRRREPGRGPRRRVRRTPPQGGASLDRGVCGATPRAGRPDPRLLPGPGAGRGAQARLRTMRRTASPGRRRSARLTTGATGRLPHPPRDRPRRHGRRLRGRAGVARPPRGAEGPAARRPCSTPGSSAGSSARPGPRPGCTTPTSCRSSASARRTGLHYYVMQFIPGLGLDDGAGGAEATPGPEGPFEDGRGRGMPGGRRSRRPTWPGRSGPVSSPPPRRPRRPRTSPGARRRSARGAEAVGLLVLGHAAGGVRPLGGHRLGPPLRPERGADRRAGGRGAGVRPPAGDPAPRHQAVEPAARRPRHRLGHRLRPGQGDRRRRPDPHRRHRRHAALHGPRAVPRPVRRPLRRLRAGPDALRAAGLPPGVRGGRPARPRSAR